MEGTGYIIRNDAAWVRLADKCAHIQHLRKEAWKQEAELFDQLKELSNGMSTKGKGFVFTRSERLGHINYNEIPLLQHINLEPFRGPVVETWKLTLEISDDQITHERLVA